jgi:hypothetical protein
MQSRRQREYKRGNATEITRNRAVAFLAVALLRLLLDEGDYGKDDVMSSSVSLIIPKMAQVWFAFRPWGSYALFPVKLRTLDCRRAVRGASLVLCMSVRRRELTE